jgi:hypothetical protein
MMYRKIFIVILGICFSNVFARPTNLHINGVYLNNGESVNYQKIESFGTEGVNFFKVEFQVLPETTVIESVQVLGKTNTTPIYCYKYRSSFSESTLVSLDYYYFGVPRIRVVAPNESTAQENNLTVLRSELSWLNATGIISFDNEKIDSAISSIEQKTSTLSLCYWSLQKLSLTESQFFKYNRITDTWTDTVVLTRNIGDNTIDVVLPTSTLHSSLIKNSLFDTYKNKNGSINNNQLFDLKGRVIPDLQNENKCLRLNKLSR